MSGEQQSSTLRDLNLDDLDQVVGGAAAVATKVVDHSQDSAFLASLGSVAAVVSSAASAMSHGTETTTAAINSVETAAQGAHISTDAALASLLGATHGNTQVDQALTTRLTSGAAETELASLAMSGHLQVADVNTIVNVVTGTLAAYSKDGQSALGMSQTAAIDVIDGKIDAAAQTQLTADQATMSNTHVDYNDGMQAMLASMGVASTATHQVIADTSFISGFESTNAAQLTANSQIAVAEGGATALQTDLSHIKGYEAHTDSTFGVIATAADAFSGQPTAALVDQILANAGVDKALGAIGGNHSSMLSSGLLSQLESAAQAAGVSTDLTLAIAESIAPTAGVQAGLATEMATRLANGTAETELVNLAMSGHLQASDVTNIVNAATGTLAQLSADGQSVLGMTQSAATDLIDAKIDSAAQAHLAADQATASNTHVDYNDGMAAMLASMGASSTALKQVIADNSFISSFESATAAQLADAATITNLEGGTVALQAGLQAALSNPLQAANTSVFGQTASIVDILGTATTAATVAQVMTAMNSNSGAAAISEIETTVTMSTDAALAAAALLTHSTDVQQALVTELITRANNGALASNINTLVSNGQLQGSDVANIVTVITNVIAAHTPGGTPLGMSVEAATDTLLARVDASIQSSQAMYASAEGLQSIGAWATGKANAIGAVLQSLETTHGAQILAGIGSEIATASAQADSAVAAFNASSAGIAINQQLAQQNAVDVIINRATGASLPTDQIASQVLTIEQAAGNTINAAYTQAQHVTESLLSAAYTAAGGAQTISAVSSGLQTALNATESAAESALQKGWALAATNTDGSIAEQLVTGQVTTLAGFSNIGAQFGAHIFDVGMVKYGLGPSNTTVLAAEGMEYLLGQSAVADVLGSHATGDLKTACQLVLTASNAVQQLATDISQGGSAISQSALTMAGDLAKNAGNLTEDLFTGNISGMKSDANQLTSQFLTDMSSLGSTIGSASSALATEAASLAANTFNIVYGLISANPDVQSAVSWVSTTGVKVGDEINNFTGTMESDISSGASSAVNAIENSAVDFADGIAGGATDIYDDAKSWFESW
jgi:hypothetical protein